MIAVALAEIRIHWARFLAVALGIALAAGFVASTLIISSSLQASLKETVGQTFSASDLVIVPAQDVFVNGQEVSPLADPLRQVDGVNSAAVNARTMTTGRGQSFSESTFALSPAPADSELDTFSIIDGTRPDSLTDLVLDEATAEELGVGIGDEIRFSVDSVSVEPDDDAMPVYRGPSQSNTMFTVVGLASMGGSPSTAGMHRAMTTSAGYQEYFAQQGDVIAIQIALDDDADPAAVRTRLQSTIDDSALRGSLEAMTVGGATDAKADRLSGGNEVITSLLLVFAGISVIVAILVVSNIFSVIVAGRRRELALLRCLGASRFQLYGSVVAEGSVVGLLGSIVGVAAGAGLSFCLAAGAKRIWSEDFDYLSLNVPPSALLIGIAVGVLLTILATIRPARSAIAVTPLEALEPLDESLAPSRHSRLRPIVGWSSIGLGVVLLVASLSLIEHSDAWILGGALGGVLLVFGLVLCSVLIIPPIVAAIGDLTLSPFGLPGRLATLNTLRNRRRTAATATALIIGVTLVATILVGGMSTKAMLAFGLDQRYPVDIAVPLETTVDRDEADGVREIAGVEAVAVAHRAQVLGDHGDSPPDLYVIDPDSAQTVLSEGAEAPVAGKVLVPSDFASESIRIKGLTEATVPVEKAGDSSLVYFTTPDVGNDLGVSPTSTSVLVKVDPNATVSDIFRIQQDVAEELDVTSDEVVGSAVARGQYSELIDVLLISAVALLFVAVLIALLGVSNTVSLSVIERRRENSLLRALGLSISQLRMLLALEAALISSVSALIGLVLGGALGIVGTALLTNDYSDQLIVDWSLPATLGILVVATLAGLLSALAPARRAARLSPVEGLKQEN
ncbi:MULTISPECIES: FtsX-like permease family protein [Brevibacterium]|uniref:ABC transport system permease protein n=2 Tax=Brevibacterium TaxID=1696 RepID=A0A1H1L2Y8_BRESA|nr:FtsX-like permease family protein [Brevibacterium sandarakinum]SDR68944.1 putative ABC transport system permease protein [Brevibacterium sandarakinum]